MHLARLLAFTVVYHSQGAHEGSQCSACSALTLARGMKSLLRTEGVMRKRLPLSSAARQLFNSRVTPPAQSAGISISNLAR
jgi:hypothetical protein